MASPNVNIVGSLIILHYKLYKDGGISSHKSRLVAQGFTQQQGVNFNDTFSPTAKLTAVRIIAAIVARNDWKLEKTDVDAAYLNATLKEDIYMQQPKGFEVPGEEDKVTHLKQAIYDLRQSRCEWYKDLMHTLTSVSFKQCQVEHVVFYRFKENLSSWYGIKDMDNLQWLLGIGVNRERENRTISFSQIAYVQKIVEFFEMEDAKPLSIPINPRHNLNISQSPSSQQDIKEMNCETYHEAVRLLMYVVIGTWLDIAYAVSYLARFMENSGNVPWEAVKRVIRYLKGTKDPKLVLGRGRVLTWEEPEQRNQLGIKGYSDADSNSQEHQNAISRYTFCIDGGTLELIRMFLRDILHPLTKLMLLYCDNQSAIAVAKNDQYHARMKHIDI